MNDALDANVQNFLSDARECFSEIEELRKTEPNTVRSVINTLPRPFREMLVLRELEGLSYLQIAEVSALPIGTVMSRLARARKHFAEAWRREANFQGNPVQSQRSKPTSIFEQIDSNVDWAWRLDRATTR